MAAGAWDSSMTFEGWEQKLLNEIEVTAAVVNPGLGTLDKGAHLQKESWH